MNLDRLEVPSFFSSRRASIAALWLMLMSAPSWAEAATEPAASQPETGHNETSQAVTLEDLEGVIIEVRTMRQQLIRREGREFSTRLFENHHGCRP
jgi:hypothetical protein